MKIRVVTSKEMRDEKQMTEKQPAKESAMTAPMIGNMVMLPLTKLYILAALMLLMLNSSTK